LPLEVAGQRLDRAQRGWTDVVFHTFHIVIDDLVIEAKEFEEVGEKVVAVSNALRERFPAVVRTRPRYFSYFNNPSASSRWTMFVTLAWEIFRRWAMSTTRAYPLVLISSRIRSR
jgi:hypothetical protein